MFIILKSLWTIEIKLTISFCLNFISTFHLNPQDNLLLIILNAIIIAEINFRNWLNKLAEYNPFIGFNYFWDLLWRSKAPAICPLCPWAILFLEAAINSLHKMLSYLSNNELSTNLSQFHLLPTAIAIFWGKAFQCKMSTFL